MVFGLALPKNSLQERLVNQGGHEYGREMLVRLFILVVLLGGLHMAAADVIQLKEKSSVAGKILAEKKDQVVVDLGYTVLTIPRNAVLKISREEGPKSKPEAKPAPATKGELAPELFQSAKTPLSEKSVRELVNQLGEGVVQVRTPGGLGSGFFINEDGYLITNFHVIEGETQISIEVYHQTSGQLERKTYKQVKIIAMNKFQDLALLKIEEKEAPKFVKVQLGDSDSLAVGETVFAIGSPL